MPLLWEKGVWRGGKGWGLHTWKPGDLKQQAEQGVRGQGTHIAVTKGTCFFQGSGSQSCCSSGGCRHHPVPPVEVGASRPFSTCSTFLSVTTLSFFREGSPTLGHLGCIGIKVASLLAKLEPSSPGLIRQSDDKPTVQLINQQNTAHLPPKTNPRCTCTQNAACNCHDMGLSSPGLGAVSTPAKMSQTQFLLLEIRNQN